MESGDHGVAYGDCVLLVVEVEETESQITNGLCNPSAAKESLDAVIDDRHLVREEQGVKFGAMAITATMMFDVDLPGGQLIVEVTFAENKQDN